MNSNMLQRMCFDLGIKKYASETGEHYVRRVLYSALASWMKAVCLDRPLTTTEAGGISSKHVYDRVNQVYSEYMRRFPDSAAWFQVDSENDSAVKTIRRRLIQHGDIIKVGFDTNISLVFQHAVPLTATLECIYGVPLRPNSFYSGISTLNSTNTTAASCEDPSQTIDEWLNAYTKTAWWQKYNNLDNATEYFDAARKAKNNQCWQASLPRVRSSLVIARVPNVVTSYEYLLINVDNQKFHRLDPHLKEVGEHRRFLMALRSLQGNKIPVRLVRHRDHVHLSMRVYLPLRETVLLESYAWPTNSITDRLEWDMPAAVWDYIEPALISLGLEITEVTDG